MVSAIPVPRQQAGAPAMTLGDLHPFTKEWTVKARVVSKSGIRPFRSGQGRMFSAEIIDCNRTTFRTVFFNGSVDMFFGVIEEGRLYHFSNGTDCNVKPADKRYGSPGTYEIIFSNSKDGSAIVAAEEDGSTPAPGQQFFTLEECRSQDQILLSQAGSTAVEASASSTQGFSATPAFGSTQSFPATQGFSATQGYSSTQNALTKNVYNVVADILGVQKYPPFYEACPFEVGDARASRQCQVKTTQQPNGSWCCSRGHCSTAPMYRWVLKLKLGDPSGEYIATAFDDVAKQITGCDASFVAGLDEKLRDEKEEVRAEAKGNLDRFFNSCNKRCSLRLESKYRMDRIESTIVKYAPVPYEGIPQALAPAQV
eukprot:gnl/MRDRNA2_/MRDRNA2_151769_c0_seq1.p1 gnl/MRDRNA2_/MRDRNA2_151769_c0~~gnl/MRDRNA2_/MRDRNA2_151769_c0_seq1.p1  ORF type:complete len:419 (-),score=77.15 gnl/MRDRNA2_/MRDRNA2_151769_c0_seq1:53-1159(-)